MRRYRQSYVAYIIWVLLIGGAVWAIYEQLWASLAVTIITFLLTLAPIQLERFYHLHIPVVFTSAIIIFTYSTLFLGEVGGFYERLWWWDIFLHGGAAIGFGLVGFVFMFMLFGGDKYAAPPIAIAWFAFCFSMTIGVLWEVFEFGVDQIFSTNMQRSGLFDTMYDLMVDIIGASLGSAAGFFYLKGWWFAGLASIIDEFVKNNRHLFKKNKDL